MENEITAFEKDQLVEVINIGASSASNALSQMVGRRVMINIPEGFVDRVEKITDFIGEPEKVTTVVLLKILGDISGTALLVFSPKSALRLANILVKKDQGEERVLDELDRSALQEVGNILLGASLTALSKFLDMKILQSVPDIATDMLGSVIDAVIAEMGQASDIILGFKVNFMIEDQAKEDQIDLQLFFGFDLLTTTKILEKAKRKLSV